MEYWLGWLMVILGTAGLVYVGSWTVNRINDYFKQLWRKKRKN